MSTPTAKSTSPAADPLVQALASNPEHFRAFFELDNRARTALVAGGDVGPLRREVAAFQKRMTQTYGRALTGRDCSMAQLITSARALAVQQCQELEVSQAESPAASTGERV